MQTEGRVCFCILIDPVIIRIGKLEQIAEKNTNHGTSVGMLLRLSCVSIVIIQPSSILQWLGLIKIVDSDEETVQVLVEALGVAGVQWDFSTPSPEFHAEGIIRQPVTPIIRIGVNNLCL
jgi:hypothetical protein